MTVAVVYLRDRTAAGEIWKCLYVLPHDRALEKGRELARGFAQIFIVWQDAATGHLVFYAPAASLGAGRRPPVL